LYRENSGNPAHSGAEEKKNEVKRAADADRKVCGSAPKKIREL
jgi:hypothetical protein